MLTMQLLDTIGGPDEDAVRVAVQVKVSGIASWMVMIEARRPSALLFGTDGKKQHCFQCGKWTVACS